MTDSFLLPTNDEQPELLPVAPSFFSELENGGEFTGERLFRTRPDTYRAIVALLAQGIGMIKIGRILGVSSNTVMAVRAREGVAIEVVKEHLANTAHGAATLASEAIAQRLSDITSDERRMRELGVKELKDLAVTFGILVQNGQLLAGQPTARVEMVTAKPEIEDFNAYLKNLPAIEIADPLDEGKVGTKGATEGATERAERAEERTEERTGTRDTTRTAETDLESEGNQCK